VLEPFVGVAPFIQTNRPAPLTVDVGHLVARDLEKPGAELEVGRPVGQVTQCLDKGLLDDVLGGVLTPLISRNTTIPTRKSETFSTAADSQPSVEVHVMQGERPMARDNRTLGKFHLDGIPPAPRGVPQIEVTFDIDANGIVNVSAKDKGTGKEQKITITATSGLSKDEVERMVKDAEAHAEEDKKRKEEVDTRNRADQAVHAAEQFMKESGDKVQSEDRLAIESAITDVKQALESGDATAITKKLDALMDAQTKAATKLYQQPGAEAPGGDGPAGSSNDGAASGDVIDAEVIEEEKK